MHWQERIDHYVQQTGFPRSLFLGEDGRVVGTWIMGNDYRVRSAYYGGYPAGYLRRVRALFPDKRRVPACCMDPEFRRTRPNPIQDQAMRTEIGRPSSSIRLRA